MTSLWRCRAHWCKGFWENSRCLCAPELPRQLVNLHKFYTDTSRCIWVCTHVYVCVYILAMGLDPSEPQQCFASCWAWEKDGSPFHSCLGRGPGCRGAPYPFDTHSPPSIPLSTPPFSLHPIQAAAYLLSKAKLPFQPFINTSHYSSTSLHRDSKGIPTRLAGPSAPQPFGPYKCRFRLSNLPVLIFVLKWCVHTCKAISVKHPMSSSFSCLPTSPHPPPTHTQEMRKKSRY